MYHVYENDYEFPLHWDSLDDAMTFAQDRNSLTKRIPM